MPNTKTVTFTKRELSLLFEWATSATHGGYESDQSGNELVKKLYDAYHSLQADEASEAEGLDHRMPVTSAGPSFIDLPTESRKSS